MELVTGIERGPNGFEANGADDQGRKIVFPCTELHKRGLPAKHPDRALVVGQALSEWHTTSLSDYGQAFGLPIDAERHTAWAFVYDDVRFVVPALAAMRGLLTPGHIGLKLAYEYHALEDFCDYDGERETVEIIGGVDLRIWKSSSRDRFLKRLTWMYCFPSARRMWSSVFMHATAGHLGLSLPRAKVTVVLYGKRIGDDFFVTNMDLQSLEYSESPFEFVTDSRDDASDRTSRQEFNTRTLKDESLPLRDGLAQLSDEEWLIVKPLLIRCQWHTRAHCAREMVDGVLERICSGTPWKKAKLPPGIKDFNASTSYRQWRLDGRWAEISDALRRMRTTQIEVPPTPLLSSI